MSKARIRIRTGLLLLLATGVLAAAVPTGIRLARSWQRQLLVEHWRQQIGGLPDDQIPPALEQLAALDPPAIRLLVELAGNGKAAIARAAQEAIWSQLDRWNELPLDQSTPLYAEMAAALAGRVDQFGPAARRFAADVTGRILNRPIAPSGTIEAQLREQCAIVLRHAPVVRQETDLADRGQYDPSTAPTTSRIMPDVSAEILEMSALPGGGLPYKPLGVRRIPLGSLPPSDAPRTLPNEPRRLPDATTDAARNVPQRLERPTRARPIETAPSSSVRGHSDRTHVEPGGPVDFSLADPLEVVQKLHAADSDVRQAAIAELKRQGYSEREMQFAFHLAHPDEQVRLALAESLPRVPGINAGRWLKWLCRDESAAVRHAALSLLATSNDPRTLQFVEQTARHDVDTRILKLAEQLAQRRRDRK